MEKTYTIEIAPRGAKHQIFIVVSENEKRRVGNIIYPLCSKPRFCHQRAKDYGALADLIGVPYFKEVVQRIYRAIQKLPSSVTNNRFAVEIEMPAMAV